MKPNNIPLPALPVRKKIFYTFIISIGLFLFIGTWAAVLEQIYLPGEDSELGVSLGIFASMHAQAFYAVFLCHSLGMSFILLSCYRLFGMTSIRRRIKKLIFYCAVILTVVDLSGWGYAPSCSSTNIYVGFASSLASVPLILLALFPLYQMWIFRRWKSPDGSVKRVVFVGGGFAGLYAALGLNRILGYHHEVEITLIDKNNYFLFPPLLPSAAAGSIEIRQVSYPFRRIFETTNIVFRKALVDAIDPKQKIVTGLVDAYKGADGTAAARKTISIPYDYLVLAPGSLTQTFNTPGAAQHAFFMRGLNDAVILRNHVVDCFEQAAVLKEASEQMELLNFVIVGAGPTGIETATEIHDLIHHVLLKRYPEIGPALPQVQIVQSGPSVLPGWDPGIIRTAAKKLRSMNIRLLLESRVTGVTPTEITLQDGTSIASRTVIWCAGVRPSALLSRCGVELEKSGRIRVNPDLRVPGIDSMFVLGDAALAINEKTQLPLPPLGQVAFQQGSHTARNLVRLLEGKPTKPFSYFDFGGLVSVGEHFAAVKLLGIKISGFAGWFIWRTLYLAKLVGVSNKIRVMADWTLDLIVERSFAQIRDREGESRHEER